LTPENIAELLQPYAGAAVEDADWPRIYRQLATYLELILKWNARINLTAIRTPEEIVRRHFGESLFVGSYLESCTSLLDFGSGAGFPGVPIQLLRPDIQVTLAESRSRKAAFLHEVIRVLGLSTEVWAARVEAMPAQRQFDTVALRAVDEMEAAVREATRRATRKILILSTFGLDYPSLASEFPAPETVAIPASDQGRLLIARRPGARANVPRGTSKSK
jgi:16S rRNA (guanine527-N7)-methyltransferase